MGKPYHGTYQIPKHLKVDGGKALGYWKWRMSAVGRTQMFLDEMMISHLNSTITGYPPSNRPMLMDYTRGILK